MNTTNIPQELQQINNWLCWKAVPKSNGKISKKPMDAKTGKVGSSTNPQTWATFTEALAGYEKYGFDGIGFALGKNGVKLGDGYLVGMDSDDSVSKNGDGYNLSELAETVVDKAKSYTEVTPSDEGLRIFTIGELPPGGRNNQSLGFEMYQAGRFLTVTGNHLPGTPKTIETRPEQIKEIHQAIFGEQKPEPSEPIRQPQPVNATDNELLDLAFSAKNGDRFKALWDGDINTYPSHSEADQALCNYLTFWTHHDQARIDNLFRQSGLYRDKWDEIHYSDGRTYGQATIENALKSVSDDYEPGMEGWEEILNRVNFGKLKPKIDYDNASYQTETEQNTLNDLWPHYTPAEGLELYSQDVEWIFYGLWQPQHIGMVYGDGAAGKTYLAVNQSIALACGLPWLSGEYPHSEPKRVLYFISEGRQEFFPRIRGAVNGMALTMGRDVNELWEIVNQNMVVVPDVPQLFAHNATRSITSYLEHWHSRGHPIIDFAIIDTLHRAAVGSDEASEKDANIILEAMRVFARETGAACELIHHSNKQGGYRGSSAYRADIDAMLKVEGVLRAPRTITIDKEKDCPPDGPVSGTEFQMLFYIDGDTQKSYVKIFADDTSSLEKANEDRIEQDILMLLKRYPKGLSQNQICTLVRGAKSRITKKLDNLIENKKIIVEPGPNRSIIHKGVS